MKKAALTADSAFFSVLDDRYSDAPMLKAAAIPVTSPARATKFKSCRAKVRPARAPVSSTSASDIPSTTLPE